VARHGWPTVPGLANRAALLLSVLLVAQYSADHLREAWQTAAMQRHAPGLSSFFKEDLYPLALIKLGENTVIQALSLLPDSASVAATEHGYLAALLPELRIMDMTGLHDVPIAHGENPAAAVLRTQPAVIMMPHYHYVSMNEKLLNVLQQSGQYEIFPNILFGIAVDKKFPVTFKILHKTDSVCCAERAKFLNQPCGVGH
jgi:hypothetical protein